MNLQRNRARRNADLAEARRSAAIRRIRVSPRSPFFTNLPLRCPLLVEGYSGMKDREAKIPPTAKTRLPEAIQRLVDLYVAWEKPEQAAEWQKQLDQAQATLKDTEPKPSKEPTK